MRLVATAAMTIAASLTKPHAAAKRSSPAKTFTAPAADFRSVIMPIWLQVVFCIVCTIQIPFAAWIVCKVIAFEKDLAALRERVRAR